MHPHLFLRHGALVACALVALACGGTVSSGTGGSSGTGAFTSTTGVGAGLPAISDAAWAFNMDGIPPPGAQCDKGIIHDQLGEVTATVIQVRVTDGQPLPNDSADNGQVQCSTQGSGPFSFQGAAGTESGSQLLQITIPTISASATKSAPVTGSVTYDSAQLTAGSPYIGNANCSFYFANPMQAVGKGKLWVSFACSDLTNAAAMSACGVSESYVVFENCASN
jgi:hypothetical protein